MLPALEKAVEHPDMTEELAEILTTPTVDVEYQVETGVDIRQGLSRRRDPEFA
jgi:hypothetical protein